MRIVVDSPKVAQLWVQQDQECARDRGRRLYFQGDTIFSYGPHFPIARHIFYKNQHTVLFTCRAYSQTTAKHKSRVLHALSGYLPHIVVADLFPDRAIVETRHHVQHNKPRGHRTNLRWFASEVRSLRADLTIRRSAIDQLRAQVAEANRYTAFFGLKTRYHVHTTPGERYLEEILQGV